MFIIVALFVLASIIGGAALVALHNIALVLFTLLIIIGLAVIVIAKINEVKGNYVYESNTIDYDKELEERINKMYAPTKAHKTLFKSKCANILKSRPRKETKNE